MAGVRARACAHATGRVSAELRMGSVDAHRPAEGLEQAARLSEVDLRRVTRTCAALRQAQSLPRT